MSLWLLWWPPPVTQEGGSLLEWVGDGSIQVGVQEGPWVLPGGCSSGVRAPAREEPGGVSPPLGELSCLCGDPCKGGARWGQPSARGTQLPLRWSPLLDMRTVLVLVFFLKRPGGFEQGLVRLAHVPSGLECWAGWALGPQAVIRALRLVPNELQAGGSWALGGLRLESPLRPFPRLPLPSSL